jgi:hypothetical protein
MVRTFMNKKNSELFGKTNRPYNIDKQMMMINEDKKQLEFQE